MKKLLLSWVVNAFSGLLYLLKQVGLIRVEKNSILVLPPSGPGSVGDEAMVVASIDYLQQRGIDRISLISYNLELHWQGLSKVSETIDLTDYFACGGWRSWKNLFQVASSISRYDRFYCLGADMMDGYYGDIHTWKRLKLVSIAAKMGLDTAILGFSFNQNPTAESIKTLSKLPSSVRLCARDPISQQRLSYRLKRKIDLVADLAFLLSPDRDSFTVLAILDWISQQKIEGRLVIGVNTSNQLREVVPGKTVENLIDVYVDTLTELSSREETLSFILIAHDFRNFQDKPSDIFLLEKIFRKLPPQIQRHCSKMPAPCSAAEIKAIVGDLDLVITGRMHLAIACLGRGILPVCVTYQGKFEGLFQHFQLEGMTIEPEEIFQPGKLVEFLLPLLQRRKEIRQKIQLQLPQVLELARANFLLKTKSSND